MKHIYTTLVCLLFVAVSAFGQDKAVPDARLYDVYSADYLTRLQTSNPFLIERWNFYLDNAFFITDIPEGKEADYSTLKISELQDLNILLIEKNQKPARDFKKRMYYQIEGTQKVLVYYSGEQFRDALNKHLGRK